MHLSDCGFSRGLLPEGVAPTLHLFGFKSKKKGFVTLRILSFIFLDRIFLHFSTLAFSCSFFNVTQFLVEKSLITLGHTLFCTTNTKSDACGPWVSDGDQQLEALNEQCVCPKRGG